MTPAPRRTKTRLPRKRHAVYASMTVVTSLVVMDLALSAILLATDGRLLGRKVPPYDLVFDFRQVEEMARVGSDPYQRFDPDLGWSLRAGGVSEDTQYVANEAGFRASRNYAIDPPRSILRIATFGDSFTHGDEVFNDETWQHYLETSSPGLEVLNFGVGGYGVDQAYLRYRRDGVRYSPNVVLIGLHTENILRHGNVYRPTYYHGARGFGVKPRFRIDDDGKLEFLPVPVSSLSELRASIEDESLTPILANTDYWVRRAPLGYRGSRLFMSSLARLIYGAYERMGRDPASYYEDASNELYQLTLSVVRRFQRETLEDGAERSIVVLFPRRRDLGRLMAGGQPYWSGLAEELRDGGISVLDMAEPLLKAARTEGLDSLFAEFHYGPHANRIVAQALADALGTSMTTR